MTAPQNFRSAFNGFNREDVVKYLEYINSRHHAQVNQLTGENDYLRQQLEAAQAAPGAQEELQRLQELCASQQAELEELRAVRTAMEARCRGMERELEEAQEAQRRAEEAQRKAEEVQSTVRCGVEQELEAYRRAERMEREARERSEQIYRQTNSVLADATVQLEDSTGGIFELADQVMGQLEQLRSAVERSKQALKNASDTMYAIRPQEE